MVFTIARHTFNAVFSLYRRDPRRLLLLSLYSFLLFTGIMVLVVVGYTILTDQLFALDYFKGTKGIWDWIGEVATFPGAVGLNQGIIILSLPLFGLGLIRAMEKEGGRLPRMTEIISEIQEQEWRIFFASLILLVMMQFLYVGILSENEQIYRSIYMPVSDIEDSLYQLFALSLSLLLPLFLAFLMVMRADQARTGARSLRSYLLPVLTSLLLFYSVDRVAASLYEVQDFLEKATFALFYEVTGGIEEFDPPAPSPPPTIEQNSAPSFPEVESLLEPLPADPEGSLSVIPAQHDMSMQTFPDEHSNIDMEHILMITLVILWFLFHFIVGLLSYPALSTIVIQPLWAAGNMFTAPSFTSQP